ncbi:MAG: hypothetical protein V7L25_05340 [Nostoc sp.]|uniref:hypothetical protein n=1 Tax=Nostoc sp. TaxID=1180 RepID=UPI002FEFD024
MQLAYSYGEASYAQCVADKPLVRVSVFVRAASPTGEGEEKALRCAIAKGEDRTASPKSKI